MTINAQSKKQNLEDQQLLEILNSLPIDYWDFRDADTKEFTHGIHNYPAMMVNPISRNIIMIVKSIRPVNALFDPFCGSGTVLVEGMLKEIPTIAGNDINPLALMLAEVKTTQIETKKLETAIKKLDNDIKADYTKNKKALENINNYITQELGLDITAKKDWGEEAPKYLKEYCLDNDYDIEIPDFKNIGYWFLPKIILELSIIKSNIQKIDDENIQKFVFVALSESIRLVSNRRNGEFKMFRMKPEKVKTFSPDVQREFFRILYRNAEKMKSFYETISSKQTQSQVSIYRDDACSLDNVPNDTYDLIITSPPYGDSKTTVAYGQYSRLSLQWINLYDLKQDEITGIDNSLMGGKKYKKGYNYNLASKTLEASLKNIEKIDLERAGDVYSFYEDLDASIKSTAEKTCDGGYQFWVVGNRTVKGELLKTDIIITELAEQYGLSTLTIVDRNIPNKVMPSLNSPSNQSGIKSTTMTMEHIIVLKKTTKQN